VDAIEAFLDRIGMRLTLAGLRVPQEELSALARQSLVLPDYKNHPKVVDINEVEAILAESFGG
jgi:alcohol dehydrogenase class IV